MIRDDGSAPQRRAVCRDNPSFLMCLEGQSLGYNIVIQSNTNKHLNPLDKQFLLHTPPLYTVLCLFSVYESLHTIIYICVCVYVCYVCTPYNMFMPPPRPIARPSVDDFSYLTRRRVQRGRFIYSQH